ncbi:MAG: antiterminator LoaP [Clostridiales bacterium]|nr:antiterminator LoaP [Clostridiales bacterium]
MWYIAQVRLGAEEQIKQKCTKIADKRILEQCFIPRYKEMKRYQGAWHTQEKLLFPGYVFMISSHAEELNKRLGNVIGLVKMLGTGDEIVPLKESEEELLEHMGVRGNALDISTGVIRNGVIHVIKGPLAGMESYIKKIDRHKRKAWLELNLFGSLVKMEAGLEITEKS